MLRTASRKTLRLPLALRRLIGDRRGVSAVEFALLAPMMIAIYFGCIGISDGVAIDRKVSLTAAALANLTAQVSSISTSDMTNIFNASSAIIAPYSAGKLKMTISCLNIDKDKKVTVKWSETKNGSKRTSFSFDSSNSALKVASSQLIYAEVTYDYEPVVGTAIVSDLTLSDHMFMSPRISAPAYGTTGCT
jgi:Flp pilus assembly protein TadG